MYFPLELIQNSPFWHDLLNLKLLREMFSQEAAISEIIPQKLL